MWSLQLASNPKRHRFVHLILSKRRWRYHISDGRLLLVADQIPDGGNASNCCKQCRETLIVLCLELDNMMMVKTSKSPLRAVLKLRDGSRKASVFSWSPREICLEESWHDHMYGGWKRCDCSGNKQRMDHPPWFWSWEFLWYTKSYCFYFQWLNV